MTFAPPTLLEVRHFFQARYPHVSDNALGIVGGPSHIRTGTSYHLGADQLKMSKNPYSARTKRDLAGLSNAASAFDLGDDIGAQLLREISVWCVGECRKKAPDTLDIREIIYSPDGTAVLTWDREKGVTSYPMPRGDSSHRKHSHFSFYRDSEKRSKVGLFRRFFEEREGGDDVSAKDVWEYRIVSPALGFDGQAGELLKKGLEAAQAAKRLEERLAALEAKIADLEVGDEPIDEATLERALRKVLRSVPPE